MQHPKVRVVSKPTSNVLLTYYYEALEKRTMNDENNVNFIGLAGNRNAGFFTN